ncbi:hypothetical protein C472_05738 [Halorubrum tebenquichense DSM 14210]|uniref:Uncharacterized protein n=1 Tax=Halorubrum tebenquichense DSM 14210 TaxID=1227485 RepID=M0DTQ9_9EURY|nr:hypothetical protein C472_05738 [Halorubrum tebenquichense DSM 14210]
MESPHSVLLLDRRLPLLAGVVDAVRDVGNVADAGLEDAEVNSDIASLVDLVVGQHNRDIVVRDHVRVLAHVVACPLGRRDRDLERTRVVGRVHVPFEVARADGYIRVARQVLINLIRTECDHPARPALSRRDSSAERHREHRDDHDRRGRDR